MAGGPPYDPRVIANELIILAHEYGLEITHLTIQKSVYFLHEKYLRTRKAALCMGHFEAWKHGPVHPQIWTSFKDYGAEAISGLVTALDIMTGEVIELPRIHDQSDRRFIVAEGLSLIETPAHRLVGMSHARGGVWDQVTNIGGGKRAYGARIRNEDIVQTRNGRLIPVSDSQLPDEEMYEQPPS